MKDLGFKIKELEKKIDGDFVSEARGMTKKQLEDKLLELSKHREAISEAKKDDPDIKKVKEELKELSRTYNESLKANNMKLKAIYLLIMDKYDNLNNETMLPDVDNDDI